MAATNTTANLELSQFVGSDKPDWLTDYNGDMSKIDSAYGAVNATAEQAAANAQAAATSAAAAAEDAAAALSGISGAIEAAQAATTAAEQATSAATSAVSIANGAAATAQSAAGDATTALSVANNAKVTAENAQAAAAQSATDAAASATAASTAQAAATQAATDAASAAAVASGVGSRVTAIEACVPATASASNQFATVADIPSGGSEPIDGKTKAEIFDYIGSYDATTPLSNLISAIATALHDNRDKITENTTVYIGSISSTIQNDRVALKPITIGQASDGSSSPFDMFFAGDHITMNTGIFNRIFLYINVNGGNGSMLLFKNQYASSTSDTFNNPSISSVYRTASAATQTPSALGMDYVQGDFGIKW